MVLYNCKGDVMKVIIKSLLFILFISTCLIIYKEYSKMKNEKTVSDITSHYADTVITNKETNLYDEDKKIIGKIGSKIKVELEQMNIDENTTYFEIKNLNSFIYYKDVDITSKIETDTYYKNYVVFNENIITNDVTRFYNDLGLVYEFNNSFNLPIIIKDIDKYYVEFDDNLLYVKKEDVNEVVISNNTIENVKNNVRTLAYHFVYKEGELCTNKYICHSIDQFTSHMKYLKDNNYFTLTMKDLELFLDNKIRIPEKSIVITLDDGYLAENAIKILNDYKINATYFLVTSWVDADSLKSPYVKFASHTHNMHNNHRCQGGNQGGQILCENKDNIIEDLKISREKLDNTEVFCYPFYDYNDYAISLLKEVGFKMAFAGDEKTNGLSNSNTDKFKIPRTTLKSSTTMDEFLNLIK